MSIETVSLSNPLSTKDVLLFIVRIIHWYLVQVKKAEWIFAINHMLLDQFYAAAFLVSIAHLIGVRQSLINGPKDQSKIIEVGI